MLPVSHTTDVFYMPAFRSVRLRSAFSMLMESCTYLHLTDNVELGTIRERVAEKSKCPQIYKMKS